MTKALVLHSGGLDSTTLLWRARRENDEVETISFSYGQSHSKEIEVADRIAQSLDLVHSVVEIPQALLRGFGSTLIDDLPQPDHSYAELQQMEGPSPTYVPNRKSSAVRTVTSSCCGAAPTGATVNTELSSVTRATNPRRARMPQTMEPLLPSPHSVASSPAPGNPESQNCLNSDITHIGVKGALLELTRGSRRWEVVYPRMVDACAPHLPW